MTTWNLNRLRYTIRKLTGKYDENQMPDSTVGQVSISNPSSIDDYINDYYLYDMPEDCRSLRLRDFYEFNTVPNCGTYAVPQNVIELYQPLYVDGYQFAFYQEPTTFYNIWPELDFIDRSLFTPNTTTGIGPYTFNLTQTPVQQGTVTIGLTPNQSPQTAGILETFSDADQPIPLDIPKQQYFVNPGILTGNQGGTGTINYLTGAVSITYAAQPPVGSVPSCHYHPYVASRPRDVMFWQQQLLVRPIPNDTYRIKLMAYMLPTTVLSAASNATVRPSIYVDPTTTPTSAPTVNTVTIQGFGGQSGSLNTDLPQFNEFWQLIAYGAALKIFVEDGEHEEYARYQPYYEKQKLFVQRKTLKQLAQKRINTDYSNQNSGSSLWPIYPYY